ncbi:uncharacterized protein LOC143039343 [Oratosquilla oratoria]|uniref:uncharacterized protein LOC143039343 n=1 Tax=Oratosquilla oratoria TaxID=337810 RepID=UPI003F76DE4B
MDVQSPERVQPRATKLVPVLRHGLPEASQGFGGSFSLEARRLQGQLIEVFKILQGFDNIDYRRLFILNVNATRSHGCKLNPPRYSFDKVSDFFTYEICNTWKGLLKDVVNSSSIEHFKSRLDKVPHTLV